MRSNYWTCSSFADWLRGTMKPKAETSQGWNSWKKEAETKHPVRFWIAEEGLDKVQKFIYWPVDQIYSFKYYINNRWVTKTHALTSHSLKRGQWYEFETRMLHGLFDELVNYVEVELAWFHIAWESEENKAKYNAPFWASGWFRWRVWRSPQAGLDNLTWAGGLKMDDNWGVDPTSEDFGKPTHQAIAANEVKALYEWWTITRPARPDPYDASGWSAYCNLIRLNHPDDFFGAGKNAEEQEMSTVAHEKLQTLEAAYQQEDEDMLIRLIKIRRSLWT